MMETDNTTISTRAVAKNKHKLKVFLLEQELQANRYDHENTKFQYLYDLLKAEIDRRELQSNWLQACGADNTLITLIRWISNVDPTIAAIMLLGRNDIAATLIAPGKLRVSVCNGKKLNVSRYNEKNNTEEIVFKAGLLPSADEERIKLALNSLSRRQNDLAFGKEIQYDDLLDISRNEGERLLNELGHQLDNAGETVQKEITKVQGNWRKLIAAVIILPVMGTIIYCTWTYNLLSQYLKCFKLCFCLCYRRNPTHRAVRYNNQQQQITFVETSTKPSEPESPRVMTNNTHTTIETSSKPNDPESSRLTSAKRLIYRPEPLPPIKKWTNRQNQAR